MFVNDGQSVMDVMQSTIWESILFLFFLLQNSKNKNKITYAYWVIIVVVGRWSLVWIRLCCSSCVFFQVFTGGRAMGVERFISSIEVLGHRNSFTAWRYVKMLFRFEHFLYALRYSFVCATNGFVDSDWLAFETNSFLWWPSLSKLTSEIIHSNWRFKTMKLTAFSSIK